MGHIFEVPIGLLGKMFPKYLTHGSGVTDFFPQLNEDSTQGGLNNMTLCRAVSGLVNSVA